MSLVMQICFINNNNNKEVSYEQRLSCSVFLNTMFISISLVLGPNMNCNGEHRNVEQRWSFGSTVTRSVPFLCWSSKPVPQVQFLFLFLHVFEKLENVFSLEKRRVTATFQLFSVSFSSLSEHLSPQMNMRRKVAQNVFPLWTSLLASRAISYRESSGFLVSGWAPIRWPKSQRTLGTRLPRGRKREDPGNEVAKKDWRLAHLPIILSVPKP